VLTVQEAREEISLRCGGSGRGGGSRRVCGVSGWSVEFEAVMRISWQNVEEA